MSQIDRQTAEEWGSSSFSEEVDGKEIGSFFILVCIVCRSVQLKNIR